jgi:multiple antibiotic resistance protein
MENFLLAFIPLLVAIDAPGVIPLFLSLTEGLSVQKKRKLVTEATLTAFVVSVVFLVLGNMLFSFLGITQDDFRIGGGIILLILAITDLLFPDDDTSRQPGTNASVGVVPIGIPLIIGPGALTTIIVIQNSQGYWMAFISIALNLAIVWVLFSNSHHVVKIMGEGGTKAFAKVAALFLAAIAVMMIRVGITNILKAQSAGSHSEISSPSSVKTVRYDAFQGPLFEKNSAVYKHKYV